MGTCKLVMGSVSVPLNNILQPVRHTLHTLAQNLAGYCAIGVLLFIHAPNEKLSS